jgi:hypothetical protein
MIPRRRPGRGWFRRALGALVIAWLVFLLEPLSSTGVAFPLFAIALVVTIILGVLALGLALTRSPISGAWLLAWLLYPVAAISLTLLFGASQSPANPLFRLRFQLSRSALDQAARHALTQSPRRAPSWVGLFPVERIDVHERKVRLISAGCGVVDECGFAYLDGAIPARRAKTRLRHLAGPWYHLYSVF